MTLPSASTSVSARGPRARVALGSLGWAYLAALDRGDWVRASQLLATFQREWNEFGSYVTELQSRTIAEGLRSLPVDGMWQVMTANALALATVPAEEAAERQALVRTAGTMMANSSAAAFFHEKLLYLAPYGDENIWMVFRWAMEAAPWDVGPLLHARIFDYIEGFESSGPETLPPDVQQAGTPVRTTSPAREYAMEEIPVTAIVQRKGIGAYWPFAVAGVGVVALFGILAVRKWGKKGRRR